MGGYYFPILQAGLRTSAGTWYRVRTYDIGRNRLVDLVKAVREATMLAFTKNDHLTVVDADFKLKDLGLELSAGERHINPQLVNEALVSIKEAEWRYGSFEVLSAARESRHPTALPKLQYFSEDIVDLATQGADKFGNKLFKRAGTITRAFRRVATANHFRVQVIPDEDNLLEGFGYINARLLNEANEAIWLPTWNPVQRARIIKAMDRLSISNARVVGRLFDVDTKDLLTGHIKCQLAVAADMDPDVDFIVPAEAIKTELRATGDCYWAVAGLEPQGPKELYWDRQTVNNHPFVIAVPALREQLRDEAEKAFRNLAEGKLMRSAEALAVDEFDQPFQWSFENYNRMLRWNANAWTAYGMSYLDSPWMTLRLGLQWPQSLGWSDRASSDRSLGSWERTLHVPVPCAMRIQIISEDSYNLGRNEADHIHPFGGEIRQGKGLPVLVVSNDSYKDMLVPSHGGSDQDDFYLVLQRRLGVGGIFNPQGNKSYIVFRNPNARGEFSIWDFNDADTEWEHAMFDGSKMTFPPITKKRWPMQILDALDAGKTEYIPLPSQVDPSKGPEDDRAAVMVEQERIFAQLRKDNKPIDRLLAKRLGDTALDLPRTEKSIFSSSKNVMAQVIREYLIRTNAFAGESAIPSYVRELGKNPLLEIAQARLKMARYAMWQCQQAGGEMPEMMKTESAVLLAFINAREDPAYKAQAVFALWYACRITPKGDATYSDQPVFGTEVFREDIHVDVKFMGLPTSIPIESHWHVIDAAMFYGLATEPAVSLNQNQPYVKYLGNRLWNVACISCGSGFLKISHKQLIRFRAFKGICKDCRHHQSSVPPEEPKSLILQGELVADQIKRDAGESR